MLEWALGVIFSDVVLLVLYFLVYLIKVYITILDTVPFTSSKTGHSKEINLQPQGSLCIIAVQY